MSNKAQFIKVGRRNAFERIEGADIEWGIEIRRGVGENKIYNENKKRQEEG